MGRLLSLKRQRLIFVLLSVAFVCAATLLVLGAFKDNIVFFYSPSEIPAEADARKQKMRVGGLVMDGSVQAMEGGGIRFIVTDGAAELAVEYAGIVPSLFREGQGVVAEGRMNEDYFRAERVLAKHDENYMPPEVADSLKRTGHWQEQGGRYGKGAP